jgi:hypothetical protein
VETCVGCGASVATADAEWSEAGLRCRPCGQRAEIIGHVRAAVANDAAVAERKLRGRAGNVAWAHGLVWSVTAVVFGGSYDHGAHAAWLVPLLAVPAIVVSLAIVGRQAWAYWMAIAIDVAAVALPLGAAAKAGSGDAWMLAGLAATVPALLLIVMLSLRRRQRQ